MKELLRLCIMATKSSSIQTVSSAPDYITTFIHGNLEKLQDIFDEGIQNFGSGCLGFQCSQETNKMDVGFMDDEMMCGMLEKDSWFALKDGIPESKKLFFVQDIDRNSVFLIYI
jgi:hypothetical protein